MEAADKNKPKMKMCPRDPERPPTGDQEQEKTFNNTLAQCARNVAADSALSFASGWGCAKAVAGLCLAPTP
jgi:hypothetical protein